MIATCPKPPSGQRPHYFFGVGLGPKRNHTALAVNEKRWIPGTNSDTGEISVSRTEVMSACGASPVAPDA